MDTDVALQASFMERAKGYVDEKKKDMKPWSEFVSILESKKLYVVPIPTPFRSNSCFSSAPLALTQRLEAA